jgi:hypothetical protein
MSGKSRRLENQRFDHDTDSSIPQHQKPAFDLPEIGFCSTQSIAISVRGNPRYLIQDTRMILVSPDYEGQSEN